MKKAWVLSYPWNAQQRLWSDWPDAQADLSLCLAHSQFVGLSRVGSFFRKPEESRHKTVCCSRKLTIMKNEPAHEILALFDLRKLIFQTRMRSHPVGLDAWCLVGPFVYFHTSCVRTAKALARMRGCAGSPEPSLVAYVISTIISCNGSNGHFRPMAPTKFIPEATYTIHPPQCWPLPEGWSHLQLHSDIYQPDFSKWNQFPGFRCFVE